MGSAWCGHPPQHQARAGLVPGLCLDDGSTSAAAVNKEFNVAEAAIVKGLVTKLAKAGITGRAAQEVLLADVLPLARSTLSWLGCSSVQEMKSLLQNVSVFAHNAGNPPCTMCGSRLWLARKTESHTSAIAACPSYSVRRLAFARPGLPSKPCMI